MKVPTILIVAATALALSVVPTALAAPANDDFAAAAQLSGARGFQEGSNTGATKEAGEPAHAGEPGGRSVWYGWTPPEDGTYVFNTFGSSFDTLLAVYTGSDVAALVEVASNDDARPGLEESETRFHATEGTAYVIAVDGFGGKSGDIRLGWLLVPPNDAFANPQVVGGAVGRIDGSNVGADMEAGEPAPSSSEASVWFAWTAPRDGTVKFRTQGTRMDTVVGVYTGSSVDALTRIASNDDDSAFGCCNSFVGFEAVAGTVYRIAVAGWSGSEGAFVLFWSPLIRGTAGADTLVGTPGVEELRGGGGNDVLSGFGGADVLIGGAGHDRSVGGSGNDFLFDHRGQDVLAGGSGADSLNARDFSRGDIINGGTGQDGCIGDPRDIRRRCP